MEIVMTFEVKYSQRLIMLRDCNDRYGVYYDNRLVLCLGFDHALEIFQSIAKRIKVKEYQN